MYIDTSALFAFYIEEEKSEIAEMVIRKSETLQISALTDVEFYSALKKRNRIDQISKEDVNYIHNLYKKHRNDDIYLSLEISQSVFQEAESLLIRTNYPLRTLDALHLAIAKQHNVTILSFDKILNEAAIELGIQIANQSG